ncbi:MAG: PorT family protein [Marinilabiliaceae bacterium]|nr:PorT family protein [Marinilabiliaceae bacterium]
MKKTVIALIVLLVTTTTWSQKFALGLKLGTTSTQYTADNLTKPSSITFDGIKNDAKTGLLFGAYAKLKLFGNLSFQPELYYAKKTGEATYDLGTESTSEDVTFHTWDIPILANYNLIDLKVAKVYAVTGPVMSFVAKNATSLPSQVGGSDDTNTANWGFQLGGGVEVWKFNLDARYEWGLSNVSDVSNNLSGLEFNRKSNMLTISIGYRIIGI